MENKKGSLSIVFLVIAIILIVVMGAFIYMQKIEADRQIAELENNARQLQETINNLQGKIDSISNTINDSETNNSKDKAIQELKKVLTNEQWIKKNLYLNENIFGEKIPESEEQNIYFGVIDSDKEESPIIVVQTEVKNSKQLSIIRYKNNEVNIKKWEPQNGSHTSYQIKDDILVVSWLNMGDWSYRVYKIDQISEEKIESYEGKDGEDDMAFKKIDDKYPTKQISKELNDINIDEYIK